MERHPDSVRQALGILDSLKSEYSNFSKGMKMHYQLIYAKGMNKGFIDFTTDSVMKQVADYYDDNGTSNEKMLAHYLLGCAYRDMGEYPAALSCYNDAVEKSDTTDAACDYHMLTRIYQQEGDLFLHQNMPQNAKEVLEKAEKAAWIAKDTLAALIAKEQMSYVYEQLKDYNAVIDNSMKVRNLYLKYGYDLEANRILGVPLKALLYTNQYAILKWCMDMYEEKSGYFTCDSINDAVDYSSFYNVEGMYFNVIHNDSALIAYRKAKTYSVNFQNDKEWSEGLYNYYKRKNNIDSIVYYAKLAFAFNDSIADSKEAMAMQQITSAYKYNRYQQLAQQRSIELKNKKTQFKVVAISVFVVLVLLLVIILLYVKNLKAKRELDALKLKQMEIKLSEKDQMLFSHKQAINCIKIDNSRMTDEIKEKKREISKLTNELLVLCEDSSCQNTIEERDNNILDKAIAKKFVSLAKDKKKPTDNQWKLLTKVFEEFFPQFRTILEVNKPLTEKEFKICMLIRLGFNPKELAILMNMSQTNISNRKRMSIKIFGEELSTIKFDSRIRQIKHT